MNKAMLVLLLATGCSVDRVGERRAAQLVSPDLVIAEVYGGGGNTGAQYKNDFVVLFNRGTVAAALSGYRLAYASASSNKFNLGVSLAGSIPAGGSYLVGLGGNNAAAGATLPQADVTGTIDLSATAGNVALIDGATSACATDGGVCTDSELVDLVGYGAGATHFETALAPSASNTTALHRGASGCVDTGSNQSDFSTAAPAPASSSSALVDCTKFDLSPSPDLATAFDLKAAVDLAKASDLKSAPDLAGIDFGVGPYLLNEVKWNPGGADTGAEYVELIGSGTLPPYTYLLSVDGDTSSTGRINLAHDLSLTPFGVNGLILVKGSSTTFAGTAAGTTIVDDTGLESSPLQNGSETVLLVHSDAPLAITVGTTKYTDLANVTIVDSIGALDTTGVAFGGASFAACPMGSGASPVDGAFRIVGNNTARSATSWYAGQANGGPLDPSLNDVSACSGGPSVATLTPGRANDDPFVVPVDMATGIADLAKPAAPDFAAPLDMTGVVEPPVDAAGHVVADMAHVPTSSNRGSGGCAIGSAASTPLAPLFLLAAFVLGRRRRRAV